MGVMGAQLYASAWGIDRTDLAEEVLLKDKSLGNSQVLPRDYTLYKVGRDRGRHP